MTKIYKISFFILIVSLLHACSTVPKIDMLAEGEVRTKITPSDSIEFNKIDVHQHGETTEIEVVIQPQQRTRQFVSGDIKLTITQPDSEPQTLVLTKAKKDHHSRGYKIQHSHFITIIPHPLKPGTTIVIEHIPAK